MVQTPAVPPNQGRIILARGSNRLHQENHGLQQKLGFLAGGINSFEVHQRPPALPGAPPTKANLGRHRIFPSVKCLLFSAHVPEYFIKGGGQWCSLFHENANGELLPRPPSVHAFASETFQKERTAICYLGRCSEMASANSQNCKRPPWVSLISYETCSLLLAVLTADTRSPERAAGSNRSPGSSARDVEAR